MQYKKEFCPGIPRKIFKEEAGMVKTSRVGSEHHFENQRTERWRNDCSSQGKIRGLVTQPLLIDGVFKPFHHSCCSTRTVTCFYLQFIKCSAQNWL